MRRVLVFILTLALNLSPKAQNTDLPGPDANLQNVPAGSYVIAMDNTLQLNSTGDFNLKAYGLVVYLLYNNVHVKWSIKAGKAKDGIDFTAMAEQLKPSLVVGGVSRDFKAGPFVIFASDTSGVAALIDGFYTSNSLTGANRPNVYRLTAAVANVDIRYDLTGYRPKAAILTDGGNQGIHLAYMTTASMPAASYTTSQGTDLLTNCFTFASEPHNTNTGTAVNNAISAIKNFVNNGGNFLAQCAAIDNYENNSLGRFQSVGGLTVPNANLGTTLNYPNPDLSFSQYEGSFNASQSGSVKNWKFVGGTANSEHDHATGTGTNSSVIGASVSKLYYLKGGLVFYVGSHSFATTSLAGINGIRMYMNAFLTPSNTNCPILLSTPLALRLTSFSGSTGTGTVNLSWTVNNNELVQAFVIEKSVDGSHYTTTTSMRPSDKAGTETYRYSEQQGSENAYYRVRVIDRQGNKTISPVVALSRESKQNYLKILNVPGSDDLLIGYYSNSNDLVKFNLYSSSGARIYSVQNKVVEGMNIVSIPWRPWTEKTIFLLETVNGVGRTLKAKILSNY